MNLSVNIAGVELKNPVMTASGTFGSGMEYSEFVDLNRLGAVVTKGVANVPWPGNPTPRVAETYGGMMNAIGLQNPGIEVFVKRDLPFLAGYDCKTIVNVCGKTTEDYLEVVERLAGEPVDLTVKEYELLVELMQNKNVTLYRGRLYEKIWGEEFTGDTRTLDSHIQRLRRKLNWEDRIKTVFRIGYRLEGV